MTDTLTVREINAKIEAAESRRKAIETERDKFIQAALEAAKEEWAQRNGDRLDAASIEIARLQNLRYDARLAEANSRYGNYVGTKLHEWKDTGRHGRTNVIKTGRVGVLAIWTRLSPRPSNLASYSIPVAGTLYIRLLKKDGTESTQFETIGGFNFDWRHPDGQRAFRTVPNVFPTKTEYLPPRD